MQATEEAKQAVEKKRLQEGRDSLMHLFFDQYKHDFQKNLTIYFNHLVFCLNF